MLLTVRTPSKILFECEVLDVTLPTRIGQITILPQHMPLTTIIEPGVIQCTPTDQSIAHNQTFVFDKKKISLSVGSGIGYIDGNNLVILATAGNTQPAKSLEELEEEKMKLQNTIEQLKKQGLLESVEQALIKMDSIVGDIKLSQINK